MCKRSRKTKTGWPNPEEAAGLLAIVHAERTLVGTRNTGSRLSLSRSLGIAVL